MRRAATFLLVAAVLAVAVAAAVDGIRGGEGRAEREQTAEPELLRVDAEEGGEPAELAVAAAISVERPAGIAVAAGSVWVASRGAVIRIDPAGDAARDTVLLGGRPGAVVAGTDAVYVLDELTGDAIRIDTGSARIAGRLSAAGELLDVAFADGDAWIPDTARSSVDRVDPLDGSVAARIPIPAPTAVTAGAGAVWVLSGQRPLVWRIDPLSNLVTPIPLDDPPGDVAVAGGSVWVSHPTGRSLTRIDPGRDAVDAIVELGSEPLLVAGDGETLWALDVSRLVRIEAESGRVAGSARLELARPPGPQPLVLGGLAAGEGSAWVADTYGGVVLRVDVPR